jgi:hypothetical protein
MKRGQVEGWSVGATRRNTQFLMSIREDELTGSGVALTLTVRDCPETAQEWHRIRKAWIERMRRAGMVRLHWVTEWQRRGVPHLHGAIWFPGNRYDLATPLEAWCEVSALYGALHRGQHARPIDGPVGWFQYLSKHAARGVKHYQRSIDNIPEGWQSKTGRVWGYSGEWPLAEPRRFGLQAQEGDGGWFRMRRMVRGWRRAESRASGDRWRIVSSRSMLKSKEPQLSRLRGFSEWMPGDLVQLRMIASIAGLGHVVCDRDTGEVLVASGIVPVDAGPR